MIEQRHVLTTVLSAGIVAAIVALGLETDWGQRWQSRYYTAGNGTRAPIDMRTLPPFQLPPIASAYKETVERPLFVPTRRPSPAGMGAQVAMKKGQFRLAGTTVSEGLSVAYLFETSTNKTHRVNKGADINGITVDMVAANRVTLKQGEETEELSLRTSTSPKPPPPPPQAVAGGPPGTPGAPGVPGVAPGAPPSGGPPLPGAPGGNFGPPVVANAQDATGGPVAGPGVATMTPQQAAAAARAAAARAAAAEANAAQNPSLTNEQLQAQQRRRRFQNLPQ